MSPHPEPVDIPSGPGTANAVMPGGRDLPEIKGAASADAPSISMISDVTFPDETLVITGDHLDGAKLRVWAEGVVRDIAPLRAANNRMRAVVPKDMPVSTMVVWPVKGGKMGVPIRVNGATAWWGWPARLTVEEAEQPQTVRIMGKKSLAGTEPRIYLLGPAVAQWLDVKSANPYCLDAGLPAGLKAGPYQVWAHNGTGGRYGWSEPVAFEVVAAPSQKNLKTFRVEEFGAKPDDEADDTDALQAAVDAAANAGGGIVAFSAGTYRVSRPISMPENAGAGIHFVGAGMGAYDPKTLGVGGAHSTLRYTDSKPLPKAIVVLKARFSTLRNLSLVNGNDGLERQINERGVTGQGVVQAYGQDLQIERVRLVLLDRRPDVPVELRKNLQLYDAALHILTPGCANILVQDCEFHSAGTGVEIGMLQPGHTDSERPEPSSDYVRIQRCLFRCYSRGFYRPPPAEEYRRMGARNHGVMNENGKHIIIEACDFAGTDRRGGWRINRSICNYNTSIRNTYYANNRSHDVGMVCPREDRVVNQGEQILFHFKYPHGGYFDVTDAARQHVCVNPHDPRNAGKIPPRTTSLIARAAVCWRKWARTPTGSSSYRRARAWGSTASWSGPSAVQIASSSSSTVRGESFPIYPAA